MKITKLPQGIRKYYWLSSVVYTLLRAIAMVSPWLMKKIIDQAIPNKSMDSALVYILLFCAIPVLITLIDVCYFRWINGVIWSHSLRVNQRVFSNMLAKPLSYFSEKKSGELLNLYKSDLTRLYAYYMIERPKIVAQGIVACLVLLSLFHLHPLLALMQLLLIPLIILPTKKIFVYIGHLSKDIFKANGLRTGLVSESIAHIKSIKVNQFDAFYKKQLQDHHHALIGAWKKVLTVDILSSAWGNSLIGPLNLAITFILSSKLVMKGDMTLGSLVLVISYAPIFCNFLINAASTNIRLANKNEEFKKTLEIAKESQPAIDPPKHRLDEIKTIAFDKVSFNYDDQAILVEKSFHVHQGQIMQLKGKNGSGKSTALDLLMGLRQPTHGCVRINQHALEDLDINDYYPLIAYMLQDIELPNISVRDYFRLYQENIRDSEIINQLKRVNLSMDIFMGKNGLDTEISTTVSNFSGGERRKLMLAALLVKDSNVVILDEFTANTDRESVAIMKKMIQTLSLEKNKIIIIVSHDNHFDDLVDVTLNL